MIADYSAETKLQSSNPFRNVKVTNKDRGQIVAKSWQKYARFNSINSEIIKLKFTKFVHDVAGLLQFNLSKAA